MSDTSSSLQLRVESIEFFVRNMYTRFPFKYGIASLTGLPHLFTCLRGQIDGKPVTGSSAEHMPPKWFTKNPETRFEEDLPDLFRVVTHAADLLKEIAGNRPRNYFEIWRDLYDGQAAWAKREGLAPLLANLGVSKMERAVLDAICRFAETPFPQLIRDERLGIDLGNVRASLQRLSLDEVIPEKPLESIIARHTVGLGDPLTEADLPPDTRIDDGLPHSLEDCIAVYGYSHFKVKLCGKLDTDQGRLTQLAELLSKAAPENYRFTLDGNENFRTVDQFVEHWEAYQEIPQIRELMSHLIFVEQPIHRDVALDPDALQSLRSWKKRPPMIIDESDGDLESLPRALELGYQGTSHKNCKGIIKGLANAALMAKCRREAPGERWQLSGEDVSNVGPIGLLQDLCVVATLGIENVERNGHHYFKGLSAYPASMQSALLASHGDLFHRHADGFATVTIEEGRMSTASVTQNAFGVAPLLDLAALTPLDEWSFASLGVE